VGGAQAPAATQGDDEEEEMLRRAHIWEIQGRYRGDIGEI